jgi:hypothetical protein
MQGKVEAFAAAFQQRAYPAWMCAMINEAHQIEQGYGTTYIAIPKADSRESYCAMEDFIKMVADQRFQAQLTYVIQGRGAFRRFKDVLFTDVYPSGREAQQAPRGHPALGGTPPALARFNRLYMQGRKGW